MAPGSARRRRRSETEDEGDSDTSANGTLSPASDSPKRPRLDPETVNGGSRGTSSDARTGANGTLRKLSEEFQPGAIIRVSVENFVTYEKADFFPGPHLNMVIGPNGTGKSSLVCAICLGLGYSPKHLGRAGLVKEFVKHGKEIATIEIELAKRPKDRNNYVVRVQIRREQNSQRWWLNGKDATQKTIQSLMRMLKIQVDNLCQFLPQDRVVEFAACTPVDLLRETLRAAAPEEMLEWQRQLRELHKEKKELAEAAHTDTETLQNLENRQQGLQADVDRIREREEIQERVEDFKGALVVCKYEDARRRHGEAKKRRKEAEDSLRRLENETGPSLQAVNDKQAYAQRIEAIIPIKERAVRDAEHRATSCANNANTLAESARELENNLSAERRGFEAKKKDVATSRSRITGFQADLKNRPPEFNAADWNQKIRAEEHQDRELEAEHRQLTEQRDMVKEQGRKINHAIQQIESSLQSLDTQQGQQLNFMRRHFPEIATGWDWVQEHMSEFEKPIFGPPMISCSIKDERYSDQVQSLLQSDDFTCFTAQTKSDYKKLTDQLYRVMSLSVVIRTCAHSLENFRSPLTTAEAQALGLDGFAIDYLDGPAPVLAMLCAEKRLHQSGVALQEHSDSQYDQLVNNGRVSQWATGKHSYTVRRRKEYGPQAMTTITKNIQPGRFWTSQPVDTHEKDDLNRQLQEKAAERNTLKHEYRELQDKLDAIKEQRSELDAKIDQLKKEKSALQVEHQKWQSLPRKIESEERTKALHEQAMKDARQKMIDIGYEWDATIVQRAKLAVKLTESIDAIQQARQELLEAKIWLIEAKSDVAGLTDRSADIMQRLEIARQNVQEATDEAHATREEGRKLTDEVRDLLVGNEEKKDLYTDLQQGKSPEDVRIEMEAEAAKLELIHAANPNVMREFEKRAQEITRLKRRMEGSNEKLGELTQQLGEVMSKFEPKLDELISKINDAFAYNFEQISCAGEVRVHKDNDFDQWALDIMVKFRENETLQQLTAHRQSGGERAVSTIFYLMALQSMAQSPFRVVDEINQGMDPRNERMVHERMVEIACREHTSQYFLITPKLLTGLRYDPKMRVLCIASGEHMPREGKKLDFRRCLKVQKGLMAEA